MAVISVSILDLDFLHLDRSLRQLKALGVRNIHLDVIDTTFTDNISFGLSTLRRVMEYDFIFDLHFMIAHPTKILRQLDLQNAWLVAVHSDYEEVREFLEGSTVRAGLALRPEEGAAGVCADYILVMTVHPGFGGQSLIESCTAKVGEARQQGRIIGVDGGVNAENIKLVKDADLIVVGSALTKSEDWNAYYGLLMENIK